MYTYRYTWSVSTCAEILCTCLYTYIYVFCSYITLAALQDPAFSLWLNGMFIPENWSKISWVGEHTFLGGFFNHQIHPRSLTARP